MKCPICDSEWLILRISQRQLTSCAPKQNMKDYVSPSKEPIKVPSLPRKQNKEQEEMSIQSLIGKTADNNIEELFPPQLH